MGMSLHYAIVKDNNDPDEKGKIQVQILPEMKDMEDSHLPWVRPFINTGMSTNQFSHSIPENDSSVWVVFLDTTLREGYFLTGAFIDGYFDFDSIKSSLDKISELSDTSYANIRFQRFPDGTITFHNDDTGEIGVYHSSGKYIVLDNNGDVTVDAGSVTFTGDHTIDGSLQVGNGASAVTLYDGLVSAMNTLLAALSTHVHPVPLFGSVGPSLPPLSTYIDSTVIGLGAAESSSTTTD